MGRARFGSLRVPNRSDAARPAHANEPCKLILLVDVLDVFPDESDDFPRGL
jgi:hypothetical protein